MSQTRAKSGEILQILRLAVQTHARLLRAFTDKIHCVQLWRSVQLTANSEVACSNSCYEYLVTKFTEFSSERVYNSPTILRLGWTTHARVLAVDSLGATVKECSTLRQLCRCPCDRPTRVETACGGERPTLVVVMVVIIRFVWWWMVIVTVWL